MYSFYTADLRIILISKISKNIPASALKSKNHFEFTEWAYSKINSNNFT